MNSARNAFKRMTNIPIPRGDFSFIQDSMTRTMLQEAWTAVEKVDAWNDLKSQDVPGEGGFMFSRHPVVQKISDALVDTTGHSGGSWGWTMRQMQSIAKNGWEEYVSAHMIRVSDDNRILREDNTRHLKRIASLENKVFTLEDEIRSLRARLAEAQMK